MLVIHDKSEDSAAGATPETMERLARRIDMERWGLLPMERAQSPETRSGALEWEVGANKLDDVCGIRDTLD
jgi:hypothetical protein